MKGMKCFVLTKTVPAKKIATITDVRNVFLAPNLVNDEMMICIETNDGVQFKFSTKTAKTTIYQN